MTDKHVVKPSYPKDTIGYHYLVCRAVFGESSPATQWLMDQAYNDSNGFDAEVDIEEPQFVYLLGQLHIGKPEE